MLNAATDKLAGTYADVGELPFMVRLIDIGGGFPHAYPGFPVPPQAPGGVIMAEPGRVLAAPGLSATGTP